MQEKIPFLITKITIPPVRERRVGRARLFDRLASYPKSGLVLVSAPAGYGKTSLLAEWCNLLGQQHTALTIAWLSLDEGDNNIFRFWTGIASAFQGLPKYDLVAKRFLERLQSNSQPGPYLEYPLRLFINDLAQNQCESIIILDDYHFISNPEIQQSILFFLNNLPSRVCLVLSTRNNPSSPILTGSAIAALPVARLRARGQILELTASDLRFTSEETGRFLTGVMNLNLNPDDVAYLDHQTEGWPAGLQLAALSLKGDPSPQSIQRFQGSDRYILEYMTQEVLNHQKPEIRDFLLQTSILSRMCAPLCETLTGKPSQAILEQIEASNLFIIPLDRRREWYRYHHLFAELLLDILTRTNRDLLTSLNRKAAIWFHQNGFTDEAIAHGVISDPDLAGYWVENSILDLITQMEVDTAQRWLKSLPPSIVMTRPGLCLAWAWIFLLQLKNSQCEMWVNQATEVIKKLSPNVSSPEEIRSFHGQIAAIRSTLAIAQSDNASALEFAHQALADLPDRLARLHALVQLNIGDALQQSDATTAAKTLRNAVDISKEWANPGFLMICSGSLVNALLIQGNLKEAETEYLAARAIEQEWIQQGSPPLNEAGKLMAIYSEVLYERNKLKTAYNLAQESILRCEKWGHIEHQIDGFVSLSRISSAMGRTKKSLLCIEQARSICTEHLARLDQSRFPQWNQKLLHKLWKVESAEVFIAYQNHQVEWLDRWIADHVPGHSIQEMSEFTRIMYTRILIQRGLKDQAYIALSILSQLFSIDQQPHPRYREALLWILTACARHTIGETDLALDALRKSITISETEGYVRIYLNIGAPAAHLLTLIQEDPSLPESTKTYGKQILDSFDYGSQQNIDPDEFYPDRLTAREKDVLHQLASGQSNSDIAINLYISENTVKTHLKHIYEKLQASNRVELIETARQLGLLP